jgi:4-amino-4-deoxy-L-arabinose transferase-like glycosyltransferase
MTATVCGMGQLQSDRVRRTTLLLLIVCGATFFAGLGRPAIGDSDEAFYAEAGREMVGSGDWITPYYNFETRFQKPILFYWLVSAGYLVAGVNEAAARWASALAGLGLALLTAACGRRWYDERTARLAGLIVATAFGYFSIGRLALPDLPLAFWITLATWSAVVGLCDRPARPGSWLIIAGAAVGLGFLTKGPVAIVVPALVVVPICWLERRHVRLPVRALTGAVIVAIAVAAPWFLAMAQIHGRTYIEGFFVGDNLERFATSRFNDPRPPWFYLPIVLGGLLPWTPLMLCGAAPLAAWVTRRARPTDVTMRLIVWGALPLLFFTASIGKQPRYILPILPPLALLLARTLERRLASGDGRRDLLVRAAAASIGMMLVALGALLMRALPLIVTIAPALVIAGAGAIIVAGLAVTGLAVAGPLRHIGVAIGLAGSVTLLGLQYGLSPAGRDPVQDMAALVVQHRQGDQPIATYRVFVRNLVFYTGVKQDDLSSPEAVRAYLRAAQPVLVVIAADDLARITRREPLRARVLGQVLYFNASAVKLRTLLKPDPAKDLERVLLVTNDTARR